MTERNRFRGSLEARRAMQAASRRQCPWCLRLNPQVDAYRDKGGAKWAEVWGHRCPHGEACPAGGDPGALAICGRCAMAGEATGTMFRCEPYQATLTRTACARRHEIANAATPDKATDRVAHAQLAIGKCVGCPVGEEHRRGEASAPEVDRPTPAIAAEDLVRPKKRSKREDSLERDQFRPTPAPAVADTKRRRRRTDALAPTLDDVISRDLDALEAAQRAKTTAPATPATTTRASAEEARTMANHGKQYEHNGQSKSLKEWATSIGITDGGLRLRLKKMSLADAIALGDGTGSPPAASKKTSTARAPKPKPTAPLGDAQLDAAAVLRALGWDVHELGTANGRKLLAVGEAS